MRARRLARRRDFRLATATALIETARGDRVRRPVLISECEASACGQILTLARPETARVAEMRADLAERTQRHPAAHRAAHEYIEGHTGHRDYSIEDAISAIGALPSADFWALLAEDEGDGLGPYRGAAYLKCR